MDEFSIESVTFEELEAFMYRCEAAKALSEADRWLVIAFDAARGELKMIANLSASDAKKAAAKLDQHMPFFEEMSG